MDKLTRHTDQLNNLQFSYTEIGEGDVIVLIPGTLGDEYLFEKIQPLLAEKFRVIVFDHLSIASFETMIETYHTIFTKQLNLSSFILGGTSVGGWIAQHYTMKHPEMVKSLIIGNSFVDNSILREQSLGIYKISRFIPWFIFRRVFEKNVVKSLTEYEDEITEYFIKSLRSMSKKELRQKLWWSLTPLPELQLDKELQKLIIYTKDDAVVSWDNTKVLIDHYPEATIGEIESGNHYPYRTNPNKYIEILKSFLI